MPLTGNTVLNRINHFLASPYYILTVLLLSVAAHLLALELLVYTVFTAVVIYACLIGNDLLPVAPLLLFSYLIPSAGNNPGRNASSIFSGPWILVLAGLIAVSVVIHVIRNRSRFFSGKRMLLSGILMLLAAYLLSGIGSAAYPDFIGKNLLFAALQGACILLPYWLLSGGVDWSKTRKDYLGWVGFCAGVLLLIEVLWSYCTGNVIVDGVIDRKQIYTGWGMYNNMGAMLAMAIPFAFYLAVKYHKGWIGTVVGSMFLAGVLITCSRTSVVAAFCIYCLCTVLMLLHSHNRKRVTAGLLTFLAVAILLVILLHRQLLQLFSSFLARILDPSSRHVIYAEGWKLFKEAPVFGSSFFSPGFQPWDFATVESFSGLFPPRWHNTVIQLLASCGVVGLGAYLLHRVQTLQLFFRKRGVEQTFIGCSLLVLIGCSLLDCHFFNMGPVLFYSAALAFMEFIPADNSL